MLKKKKSENFEDYCGEFLELFRKILRINCITKFRKSFQKISEEFEKFLRHFREVSSGKLTDILPKMILNNILENL